MRIAIVDDMKSEQNIIVKYLLEWAVPKNLPMDIKTFENSESFLFSWADEINYDLLILDIEMGKMNGMELARHIRSEDELIPIMFVTGYDEYIQYGYDVSAIH